MSRPHVVVADDEARFRENIAKILQHRGFVVSLAKNGEEVLDLLQTVSPEVVLLDVKMPGLNGDEALPRILAMKPGCKVIVLTGHGDQTAARRAFESGAFDYLCKPCDVHILASRIHEAVGIGRNGLEREKTITEIMIPIDEYTCVQASNTVREGIAKLKLASESFISSGLIMESGHRALLVFDGQELVGVLTMRNLIQAILPEYLRTQHGPLPMGLKYSSLFWSGLFNYQVKALESRHVGEIMNPRPPVVNFSENLMQVAYLLCEENRRRVAVEREGKIIGVVREQELFHEISRQISSRT